MLPVMTHLDSHLKAKFSTNKYVKKVQKCVDFLWKKYHEEGVLRRPVSKYVGVIFV